MTENPERVNYRDIFDRLLDSLVENELQSFESMDDYFRSQKISPDELIEKSLKLVTQWKQRVRLQRRRQQYESFRSKLSEVSSILSDAPIKELKDGLAKVFSGEDPKMASIFWHKLEELTESDLRKMVHEQRVLALFINAFEKEIEGKNGG